MKKIAFLLLAAIMIMLLRTSSLSKMTAENDPAELRVRTQALIGKLAPNSTLYSDGIPPTRFQNNTKTQIYILPQTLINKECNGGVKLPENVITLACSSKYAVYMPNPCLAAAYEEYAKLLCHELGHINGWPTTHGD